jgi:hypothetical protein
VGCDGVVLVAGGDGMATVNLVRAFASLALSGLKTTATTSHVGPRR